MGVILSSLGVGGYFGSQWLQDRGTQSLLDQTVRAEVTDLTQRLRVSGTVQPIRQVNVSPRQAGILAELYVDEGDGVVAGELLARMDYGDLTSGLAQSRGRLAELESRLAELQAGERAEVIAAAEARVVAIEAQVDLARKDLERFSQLFGEGAVAQDQIDQRLSLLDQRTADLQAGQEELARLQAGTRPEVVAQMEAQIVQARAQVAEQQSRIEETEVRAPFAGRIIQRFADEGAFVTPTTSASDATAASSSSILSLAEGLEIRADVPEAQIGEIEVGQPVEIRAVAFPEDLIAGRVKRIAPSTVVVREVTIVRVFVEPTDPNDRLRIGMNVAVEFVGDELPEALAVPSVAIIYQDEQQGIIVWDPEKQAPRYQTVVTGITEAGLTQVLEGLAPGEQIFTSLPPGIPLERLIKDSSDVSEG